MSRIKRLSGSSSASSRKPELRKSRRSGFAADLIASLADAASYVRGEQNGCQTHVIPMPDVKSVREEQGMTQQQFAQTYRIPLATLKNWEQGRRDPDSTIGAYMQVIAARPAMVQKILSGQ